MWLLHTAAIKLEEFHGSVPPYAILSHTWSNNEVSFQEMLSVPVGEIEDEYRYQKIRMFCRLAKQYGFEYCWIDNVCIDKRSSAELSEAINSMYSWYREAKLCIIYFVDVPPKSDEAGITQEEAFRNSRWFTRGWTLQELIAPKTRLFFANDWSLIENSICGSAGGDIVDLISSITRITPLVLRDHSKLQTTCVAERMSWAAKRQTTRPEDAAYSLMGIFSVNMAILYGEGLRSAFWRLQNEIMQTSFDQTIFSWKGPYESSGLLAHTPDDFADLPALKLWKPDYLSTFSMTNMGLQIQPFIYNIPVESNNDPSSQSQDPLIVYAALQCSTKTERGWDIMFVQLKRVEDVFCTMNGLRCKAYRRVNCQELDMFTSVNLAGRKSEVLLVLEDKHNDLIRMSIESHWENAHE